ncbi:MAG: helix-turn-helix domain-containing protein [Lewinellaceae bacterium]|nr:helix-turn-helix domain-containing protein [Lewinellaceae bacterium]
MLLLVGCKAPSSPTPATDPNSQTYILNNSDNHQIREFIQILPDADRRYTIEDIVQPQLQDLFVAFPDKTFEPQSHQAYWGKILLENRLPEGEMHREWVLNFTNTFTRITLYRLAENGTWTSEVNGTFVPAHRKKFTPTRNGTWFKLQIPPGEAETLYFRGESERSALPPTFNTYVQPLSVFYDNLAHSKALNALFAGLLLMMLLYSLINFFIVRDRSYIYYSGYLLMVVVYTAYISEDLEDWIGGFVFSEHPAYFNLFKGAIYLGLMSWLAFIRSFLDLEHLLPRWDRFFQYVIWLGAPLIVLFIYLAFRYDFSYVIDDRVTMFYIALVTISGFLFIYPLYRTKDRKGYFITAGIAVICLGFLLTFSSRVFQTDFTVGYLKVSTIVEILIFSLGLAYRQKEQVEAKQKAEFALRESWLLQEKQQEKSDRLQELDDFKSRFFTNITHEFRTPLTVILGLGEQLAKAENDAGKRSQLGLIQRSGKNLLRLVNQILDLAKLESNTLKLRYIQGDVLAFIRYIAESLHSLANAQNLLVKVESAQAQIVMDYDPERLLQIIHNLLSNAIKFTPSGGKVLLKVDLVEQWLRISVADTGAGIPSEALPHVFERFFQANNQDHSGAGGTGIGLSMTRELVKAMGGDISVESTVGAGSTFTVQLPVTQRGELEEMPGVDLVNTAANTSLASPLRTQAGEETDGYSILLIEDNPDVVEYLTACLQGATDNGGRPYGLEFAYNGQAGIEKALDSIPDLIISDVMMPVKDGFEVLETLKNNVFSSHIPIVLLTAKADMQSRLAGLQRGADAYLSKPFHQDELLLTVANLLESRKKLQLKYQQNVLSSAVPEVQAGDPEDSFLQKVRAIVEANYRQEDFGLPQLCREIGMSRSQLFRKMKALTDLAPSDLIRTHRLNNARALLESGAANVAEAAWEVGFKDPSYFSKLYQEEFGEAPSTTRK